MSRISDIILRVRDTLADPTGDRWSDERLIRLVDEAQKDICRKAKLLRAKTEISIFNNKVEYNLPDDLLLLDRVLYDGRVIPFVSHLELDRRLNDWESDTGTPQSVVYDKQNRRKFKLYPIPDLEGSIYKFIHPGYWETREFIEEDFGIITNAIATDCECVAFDSDYGIASSCIANELIVTPFDSTDYGIVVSIDGVYQNSDYGILVSLSEDKSTEKFYEDNYGVTVGIQLISPYLTVYYLKKPNVITSLTDILEIDDSFDAAIKYYVTGKALRDDMDTQNRVIGNEELAFYDRELKEAIKDDIMDFTRNSNKQYEFNYRGAF